MSMPRQGNMFRRAERQLVGHTANVQASAASKD